MTKDNDYCNNALKKVLFNVMEFTDKQLIILSVSYTNYKC